MSITHDILAGVGLQIFNIDITGSDSDLMIDVAAGSEVRVIVYNDESGEAENEYSASGAVTVGDPLGVGAVVYTVDIISAGITTTHTYFKFSHRFDVAGDYYIALIIEDASGNRSSTADAIRVGIGSGLPKHIKV